MRTQTTRERVTERFLDKHFDLVCHLVNTDPIRYIRLRIEEVDARDVDCIADTIDSIIARMCVEKYGEARGNDVHFRASRFIDVEHVAECVKGNIDEIESAFNARI